MSTYSLELEVDLVATYMTFYLELEGDLMTPYFRHLVDSPTSEE